MMMSLPVILFSLLLLLYFIRINRLQEELRRDVRKPSNKNVCRKLTHGAMVIGIVAIDIAVAISIIPNELVPSAANTQPKLEVSFLHAIEVLTSCHYSNLLVCNIEKRKYLRR
jgi:hypothetical protein